MATKVQEMPGERDGEETEGEASGIHRQPHIRVVHPMLKDYDLAEMDLEIQRSDPYAYREMIKHCLWKCEQCRTIMEVQITTCPNCGAFISRSERERIYSPPSVKRDSAL